MSAKANDVQVVARNSRARRDFHIEDTCEAGIVLKGTEVKSLRNGSCSLGQADARSRGDELYLLDMHIPPYEQANIQNHEPTRPRKLLLHRREIDRIISRCTQRGYTLIPLRVYFRGGYAKVQLGLARRRRRWDKRDKKEAEQRRRDAQAALARRKRRQG
ncbi:MAG: SsrA-binding protein SmpB [Planctomycetota bacterium]|jgi:SsrA-binding protein